MVKFFKITIENSHLRHLQVLRKSGHKQEDTGLADNVILLVVFSLYFWPSPEILTAFLVKQFKSS